MKFILQESKKFILEERFILNEADADSPEESSEETATKTDDSALVKIKEEIKNTFDKNFSDEKIKALIDFVTDKGATEAKAIMSAEKAVQDQFDNSQKDWSILSSKVKAYCSAIKAEINKAKNGNGSTLNSLTGAAALIANLEDACSKKPTNETELVEAIENLKSNFNNLKVAINTAIDSDTSTDIYEQEYIDQFTEASNVINSTINAIFNLEDSEVDNMGLTISALTKFNNILKANILPNLKGDRDEIIETASDKLTIITDACTELANTINLSTDTGDKWASEFDKEDSVENKRDLWKDYYEKEWGKDTNKIKALGDAFTQEVLNLGFTEDKNPFITFIKNNLNKLNINAKNYPAIHNAYLDKAINDAILRDPNGHLLGNTELMKMPAKTILNYLIAEKELTDAIASGTLKAADNGYKDNQTFLSAIFTKDIDVRKGKNPPRSSLSDITSFRSWSDLQYLLKELLGKEVQADDVKISVNSARIWRDVCREDPEFAKKVIKKLADSWGTTTNKLLDTYGNIATLSDSEKKIINNSLTNYDIDKTNVITLVNDLAKKIKEVSGK